MSNLPPRQRMMPRDGAGQMDLIGGTGPVMHPIGMPGFMELYKVDRTFRAQAPDNVDPARTKPNVPWTWRVSDEVGCANPIVGRVFIQCAESLNNIQLKRGDSEKIKVALHTCKEDLRNCEKAFLRISAVHDQIVAKLAKTEGLKVERGVINDLPGNPNLEYDATIFLTNAKRALQGIAEVLNQFYGLTISNARFDKGRTQLKGLNPPPDPQLVEMLEHFAKDIERVLNLRNFLEHTPKKTIIEDFGVSADALHPPRWRVDPDPPSEMLPDMQKIIGGLINVAECCFFIALIDNIDSPPGPFAYVVEEIPEAQREGAAVHFRCELKQVGEPPFGA